MLAGGDVTQWDQPIAWLIVGFLGQSLFFGRFLLQWLASERARKSVVPMAFWYLSIAGGLITLVYAIYRKDIVFVVGQAVGTIVYVRNIYFRRLERSSAE
jgi:lipid-A-disaccharide synthase-like uncharacterized protein